MAAWCLTTQAELPWGDASRLGRPFSKDPSVIRFGGRYLLYYSLPAYGDKRPGDGWAIGIAESKDLKEWKKIGEILPEGGIESKGLCAPQALVIEGRVHLFYQTYGNGKDDAICHAESAGGLKFERDATNPIWRPKGEWTAGRAIDAEVVNFQGKWFLYAATRDPAMKVQMMTGAWAPQGKGFGREVWTQLKDGPLMKPELDWEGLCIEAPTVVLRGSKMVMFYAGAYNNAPQQIGVAESRDGVNWRRLSEKPFMAVGKPGSWNSSESGHPGAFVDEQGRTWLFYQGNPDKGRTWLLDKVEVKWKGDKPVLAGADIMQKLDGTGNGGWLAHAVFKRRLAQIARGM
jgi:predicted GH43/DUF377 family glycosyl hydrolase